MINNQQSNKSIINSATKNSRFLTQVFKGPTKNKGDILQQSTQKYFVTKIAPSTEVAEKFLQEIKPLIHYTLTGDDSQSFNEKDLKQSIDILRTNQNSLHSLAIPTKSMIDFIATLYIAYIYRQKNGENGIKNIFCLGFGGEFKKFLQDQCDINPDKIPNSYLDSIKYTQFATIKFNNYTLDISGIGINGLKSINATIKNKSLREYFTAEEIKNKKEAAQKYYASIHDKISRINDLDQRRKLILNLIYFNKLLNATQRKFVRTKMSHLDLLELAKPIFSALSINNEKEQIEFINHSILLNFHQNNGLWVKRIFIQIPLITTTTVALAITVLGALWLARDWWFTLIGAGVEGLHDCEGVGRDMILEKLGGNFNVGDRLNSYTKGMDKIFTKLSMTFDNIGDDSQHLQNQSYQQSNAWKYLPQTSKIIDYLNNKTIPASAKIQLHQYVMQNCISMGPQLRKADLTTLNVSKVGIYSLSKYDNYNNSYIETYHGEINKLGQASGRGEMAWSNSGHIYEGGFVDGVPHGMGVLIKGSQKFEVKYERNQVVSEKIVI